MIFLHTSFPYSSSQIWDCIYQILHLFKPLNKICLICLKFHETRFWNWMLDCKFSCISCVGLVTTYLDLQPKISWTFYLIWPTTPKLTNYLINSIKTQFFDKWFLEYNLGNINNFVMLRFSINDFETGHNLHQNLSFSIRWLV